jgi:excisionase family DNA binding protein
MNQTELMDVRESAAYLHWRESTVRSHILNRKVDYVKLGRRVFLKRSTLDDLIERSTVHASAENNGRRVRLRAGEESRKRDHDASMAAEAR